MGGSVKHILEWKCFCGPLNPIPPLCIQLWQGGSRFQLIRGQYNKDLTNSKGVWSGLPEFKEGYPYDRGTMARAGLHCQYTNSGHQVTRNQEPRKHQRRAALRILIIKNYRILSSYLFLESMADVRKRYKIVLRLGRSCHSIESYTMAGDNTFNVNSLTRIYLEIRRRGIYDR